MVKIPHGISEFEVIKSYTVYNVIERFFATGVTPLTLDSMTSGFNITTSLTLNPTYTDMTGLTAEEVRELVNRIENDKEKQEEIYKELKENYAIVEELLLEGEAEGKILQSIELDKKFGREDFLSLLFYNGYTTIKSYDDLATVTTFRVPNYISKKLYEEYYLEEIEV